MKVSELIVKLQELEQEHGDLTVRMYADHGQCSMSVDDCGIGYVEVLSEYMADTIHESDLHDYPDAVKFCEVW